MKLIPSLVASLLPFTVLAQNSPAPSASVPPTLAPKIATLPAPPPAPDAVELTKLLKDFLAGASRNDAATHDRFWAEDLIYTGSSGRRLGKADIMRDVREEAAAPAKADAETAIFTAEDIRIQQDGATAIVAFRTSARRRRGTKLKSQTT